MQERSKKILFGYKQYSHKENTIRIEGYVNDTRNGLVETIDVVFSNTCSYTLRLDGLKIRAIDMGIRSHIEKSVNGKSDYKILGDEGNISFEHGDDKFKIIFTPLAGEPIEIMFGKAGIEALIASITIFTEELEKFTYLTQREHLLSISH